MAGHQGPGRLLAKRRRKLIPLLIMWGLWNPVSQHPIFRYLFSCLSPGQCPLEYKLTPQWVLCAEVREEDVTCRPRGRQLGWELGPGKILVIYKQGNKKQYCNSYLLLSTYLCQALYVHLCL
uniref:Uncharacterized protein n=1 Tax=Myotis myotis TaxID=51298 RepID=A0A7J7UPY7_MYOMY|nr:hypothetical protein mMyoMyo1_008602 [Myotis myotis]